MNIISRFLSKINDLWVKSSSERYVKYLINKGVQIGTGTHIDARTAFIDITRPSLVTIGRDCYLNEHFTLLTHDYTTKVFLHKYGTFVNSSGKVTIGNNVSFGQHVMVLKGVTIGDNSFIGAGSIVTKDIPANSVAVGIPCHVIMSMDEYYSRRLEQCEYEAFEYARSIKERFSREPLPKDFWEEFPLFVSGDEINNYKSIPIERQLGEPVRKVTD